MSVSRIAKLGLPCDTSEGRFQVAQLAAGTYRLLIGRFAVKVRDVLPIDAGKGRAIEEYGTSRRFRRRCSDGWTHSKTATTTRRPRECEAPGLNSAPDNMFGARASSAIAHAAFPRLHRVQHGFYQPPSPRPHNPQPARRACYPNSRLLCGTSSAASSMHVCTKQNMGQMTLRM
jgi:hypothetical protein